MFLSSCFMYYEFAMSELTRLDESSVEDLQCFNNWPKLYDPKRRFIIMYGNYEINRKKLNSDPFLLTPIIQVCLKVSSFFIGLP